MKRVFLLLIMISVLLVSCNANIQPTDDRNDESIPVLVDETGKMETAREAYANFLRDPENYDIYYRTEYPEQIVDGSLPWYVQRCLGCAI